MSFKTKHWTAQIDRTPGNQSFRVNATVTVEDPRVLVRLELSTVQDNPFDLRLDLIISKPMDTALQGETEKLVTYKKWGIPTLLPLVFSTKEDRFSISTEF